MNSKKWTLITFGGTAVILLLISLTIIIIDPFFHYHKPLSTLYYPMENERYLNDGIMRHFEYDTLITGTSLTENFKVSECDEIFRASSVKVPFPGGYYKEIDENIRRAIHYNPNLKTVIRCLDYDMLIAEKDLVRYDSYPEYLYDHTFLNDFPYLLNKEVLINNVFPILTGTLTGKKTMHLDEYKSWHSKGGKDIIFGNYTRDSRKESPNALTEADVRLLRDSISQNVLQTVSQNPQVTFYIYFPPYSICFWDNLNQAGPGTIEKRIALEKIAIEMMLPYENIRLFSFMGNFDLVCDFNQYRDLVHYTENINTEILHWMKHGEYELTPDNYEDYLSKNLHFYTNYDYNSIFES